MIGRKDGETCTLTDAQEITSVSCLAEQYL